MPPQPPNSNYREPMHLDPEALMALAGLEPMPRRPLSINPCPPGYELRLVGGSYMCVLEGADRIDPLKAQMMAADYRSAQAAIQSSRGIVAANPTTFGGTSGLQGGGG